MAETVRYNSTPSDDDDWLLLCDFLALITERTKSETAAKQLILDFYAEAKQPYGYRYQKVMMPNGRPGLGVPPVQWRGSAELRRWGHYVEVDWKNNCVIQFRTAPDPDDVECLSAPPLSNSQNGCARVGTLRASRSAGAGSKPSLRTPTCCRSNGRDRRGFFRGFFRGLFWPHKPAVSHRASVPMLSTIALRSIDQQQEARA
jgi:hypothetical protein